MKTKYILIGFGALILACVCFLVPFGGDDVSDDDLSQDERETVRVSKTAPSAGKLRSRDARRRAAAKKDSQEDDDEADENGMEAESESVQLTEEEKREAEDEKRVEDFDNMTDKWMEPSEKGVTMADVDNFASQFSKLPEDRKEECLQRALNLVPDENVMLLAGILMDKSQNRELLELIYNDVLNRDEDVKMPILKQIFADKDHPCWPDTAWILDATGDLPKADD